MIKVCLAFYVFLAWFGTWSTMSGIGAFFFFLLFTAMMIEATVTAYIPKGIMSLISLISNLLTFGIGLFLPVIAGLVLYFGYFFGLGDIFTEMLPSIFPAGGYLFSDAGLSWQSCLMSGIYLALVLF